MATLILAIGFVASFTLFESAFAQVGDDDDNIKLDNQVTLSRDNITDNPLAQDILDKIEQTKQWIATLEEKEDEQFKIQEELKEKREQARTSLDADLKEWELLWYEFSFDYAFERKQGIFWDQYNFTKSKILAGRAALQQVLSEGGSAVEARSAYVDAAKIPRSEMIAANNLFNVKHGLAYYNQQILFDSDGQFHDIVSGDKLRMYYTDFRTSPSYLDKNADDEISWIELSAGIDDECREGYVLVHRFQADDYVCVTEQTSEMWIRHNMGKPMSDDLVLNVDDDDLDVKKFREDSIVEKVKNINNRITNEYKYYDEKIQEFEKRYEYKIIELQIDQTTEERILLQQFDDGTIPQNMLIQKIEDVREEYDFLEKNILAEKERLFEIMTINHDLHMKELVGNFEFVSDVQVKWDPDTSSYNAVRK